MCRGGAVPRGEVCKTGEAPARGAARSAAGGRRRRPKAGDAFRGGGDTTRPLTQNLRGEWRHFPRKTSRGTRPARPAGGGTNAFCFLSLVAPAPPRLPELSVSRLRAGAAQSFSAMQSARGTRNKKQSSSATQTFRFNFPAFAFVGVSAIVRVRRKERPSPPRPSYPVGAGRGYSRRETESPSGRTFRIPFPSSGKVSPARGAHNKQLLIAKNQK